MGFLDRVFDGELVEMERVLRSFRSSSFRFSVDPKTSVAGASRQGRPPWPLYGAVLEDEDTLTIAGQKAEDEVK